MPPRNTPLRAIRDKCLECSGGNKQEVQECVIEDCPLYPFRMGVDPHAQAVLPGAFGKEGKSGSSQNPREKDSGGREEDSGRNAQKQHTLF